MISLSPPERWLIADCIKRFIQRVNRDPQFESAHAEVLNQSRAARHKLEQNIHVNSSIKLTPLEARSLALLFDVIYGPNTPPGSIARGLKWAGFLERDGSELHKLRVKLEGS